MKTKKQKVSATCCGHQEFLPPVKNTKGGQEFIGSGTLHNNSQNQRGKTEHIGAGTLHQKGGQEFIGSGTLHSKGAKAPLLFNETITSGTLFTHDAFLPSSSNSDQGYYMYQTRDAEDYFISRFPKVDGKHEIEVLSQPNYCSRDHGLTKNHKYLSEPDYREKLIIPNNYPTDNLDAAKEFFKNWAERTQKYIRKGVTLDEQTSSGTTVLTGEFILPSTLFKKGYYLYRTLDGGAFFNYQFLQKNGYFEIVILAQTQYALSSSGSRTSHRLPSSLEHREKICIQGGHEPTEENVAHGISREWAELTWEYIKTGETIDDQLKPGTNQSSTDEPASFSDRIRSLFN